MNENDIQNLFIYLFICKTIVRTIGTRIDTRKTIESWLVVCFVLSIRKMLFLFIHLFIVALLYINIVLINWNK